MTKRDFVARKILSVDERTKDLLMTKRQSDSRVSRSFSFALLLILSVTASISIFGQGGTGKLPPPGRHPMGNPPRGNPGEEGAPQSDYVISINKTAPNNGVVSGDISWRGPTPKRFRVDMSADSVCQQLNPRFQIEEPMVRRGKLANVFVYIKNGMTADGKKLSELSFPVPDDVVVLDQKGCLFIPHVVGVIVNQRMIITNSDPTTHNIHFMADNNPDSNQSQPAGAAPLTRRFTHFEVMARVRCNQHPWMKAYVGVLPHPFFAITGEDGKFEIRGLPPGRYTLAAWREAEGKGTEITRKVTVKKSP